MKIALTNDEVELLKAVIDRKQKSAVSVFNRCHRYYSAKRIDFKDSPECEELTFKLGIVSSIKEKLQGKTTK